MKKYISLLLLFCMLVSLFAGCDNEKTKIDYSEYYSGNFSVPVPEGWKAFSIVGDSDVSAGVSVRKGASDDDNSTDFPGVEFHALAGESVVSVLKEEYDDAEDVTLYAGKRQWRGISYTSEGKKRLYLEYSSAESISADILLVGDTKAINIADESLLFILEKVVFDRKGTGKDTPSDPVTPASSALMISEVMSNNDSYIVKGTICDWIELYNSGDEVLDLADYCLSNNEAKFGQCPLSGTIQPGEYLLFVCNNEEIVFNLSKLGESVFLFDCNGNLIQRVDIPELEADTSYVIGTGVCDMPTPGYSNDSDGYFAYSEQIFSPVIINEVLASNSKYNAVNGKYFDMIELKNISDNNINLSNYCLSDDKSDLSNSPLPDKELAPGEFYLYPAAGTGSKYAQFKVSASGETVYLSDKNGNILDIIRIPELPANVSYGRSETGYSYFATPSLGKENSGGTSELVGVPEVSIPGGFYSDAIKVSIIGEGDIYYTTDGSDPSTKGSLYKGGEISVSKTLAIRVCSKSDGITSRVATYNYFIGVPDYSLSVVKVTVDHNDMFGSNGIWTNYNKSWEKPANISMYTDGKLDFSINCGVKIFGGGSRAEAKKSLALKFRSSYGASTLKYEVFPGYEITEFNSLVLRSGVETMATTVFRDEIAAELALSRTEFASTVYVQNYRPVNLYINGEYYGIYFIREKLGDDYVESHLGVSADTVTVIECKEGSATSEMGKLISYMEDRNMNDAAALSYVSDRVDIDCFIDYYILRAYTGDKDYPNIRFFKSSQGDGKWRVMFYDVDWGFYSANASSPFGSYFEQYHHTMARNSAIMYLLLKNDTVKDKFLKRTAYLLDTALSEESLNTAIDKLTAMIQPDIEYDRQRWGYSVSSWEKAISSLKNFVSKRRNQMVNDAKDVFNLSSTQAEMYFGKTSE